MKKNRKKLMIIVLIAFALVQLSIFNTINFSVAKTKEEDTLSSGNYIITSALNDNNVFNVSGNSLENGANIIAYKYAWQDNEIFEIKNLGENKYKIISYTSKKSLDIPLASKEENVGIIQFDDHNAENQEWIIQKNEDGTYCIISGYSNLYLNLENGENKTQVTTKKANGTKNQKFIIEPVDKKYQPIQNGTYSIKSSADQNYAFNVAGGTNDNGLGLILYQYSGAENEKFDFNYLGNGLYSITAKFSGKSLDVAGADVNENAKIIQYDLNQARPSNQVWRIKKNTDNTYSINSLCSNLYLNATDIAKHADIVTKAWNNTKNEKFVIKNVNSNEGQKPAEPQEPDKSEDPVDPEEAKKEKEEFDKKYRTVEDGTYIISSPLNSDFVFDVAGASQEKKANVGIYFYNGGENQKFEINYIDDYTGTYTITAKHSGQVLDVCGCGMVDGTNIIQHPHAEQIPDNQRWYVEKHGDGTYSFRSKLNNLYIDLADGILGNCPNIQVHSQNNNRSQRFNLETSKTPVPNFEHKLADGVYSIETGISSDYVIDTASGSMKIDKKNGNASQKFSVSYVGDGTYTMTNLSSRKVVDVCNNGMVSGTEVIQYQRNEPLTKNQKWIIKDLGDGYYNIVSALNYLDLDLAHGDNLDKAIQTNVIQLYTRHTGIAQKFKFVIPPKVSDTIDVNRYPGYKEKIAALENAHPSWNFNLNYLNKSFAEVIRGERQVHNRNLVPATTRGDYICPDCGTVAQDSGGWRAASELAIAYYMDPRNFLDDTNVFQFMDVNCFDEATCSIANIQRNVAGTFLANYYNDIYYACRNTNTSPYFILARLFQEQGRSGTRIGRGMPDGGQTYYNPFNINASGTGQSAIYNNALNAAKGYGWNTMEKGLAGGINFLKKWYLENYQGTLYKNKFDVDDRRSGSGLYSHQYMQNLMAPYNEARNMKSMYASSGTIDIPLTFEIPMYESINDVSGSSSLPSTTTSTSPMDVRITSNTTLHLREQPTTSSNSLGKYTGETLSVKRVSCSDGYTWHQVIMTDGQIGYMRGDYLQQIADKTNCSYAARINNTDVRLRVGPSTRLDQIGYVNNGEQVTVINNGTYNNIDGHNWSRIKLSNGTQGFVASEYLS